MIAIIALYAILASTFTSGKAALLLMPPLYLTAMRMILAGFLLLGVYLLKNHISIISKRSQLLLFIASFLHIFIPYSTEFIGLQYISGSHAALLFNLTPCFTAIFAYYLLGDRMSKQQIFGFLIGMIGVTILTIESCQSIAIISGPIFAYVLLLISVISCSIGWIIVKKLLNSGLSITIINGWTMLLGGFYSLLAAFFFERFPSHTVSDWYSFGFYFSLLFIAANIIFYNAYGYLLKRYKPTVLSFFGCITPCITALYEWLFHGLYCGNMFLITYFIVIFGLYIFWRDEL